jgi:cyclohexadieny/prephenate dehydrogenase
MTGGQGSGGAELSPEELRALGPPAWRRLALIGTGHIGGSVALGLRAAGRIARAVGYDLEPAHAARALELGIVDEVAASPAAAAAGADLVVLATPVGALAAAAAALAPALERACLVVDVGSTKAAVAAAVERSLPLPGRYVPCHPIAGTERTGPDAADAALLRGRRVLLTPTARTLPEALAAATGLWTDCGARATVLDAALHDRVLAIVSHLPHVAAFALAGAVDRLLEADPALGAEARGLAGGGFLDTTRIAASDPSMWRDIFVDNRAALLPLVDALVEELGALAAAIREGDGAALLSAVTRARRGRQRVVAT